LTVFPASDKLPQVSVVAPASGDYLNPPFFARGTASDDSVVVRVEVQIDEGVPVVADGTTNWSASFGAIGSGLHAFRARAFDGNQYSATTSVLFWANGTISLDSGTPVSSFDLPLNGSAVRGTLQLAGTAGGPDLITQVLVSFQFGSFDSIGATNWVAFWDTTMTPDGWYKLSVEATDTDGDKSTSSIWLLVNNTGFPPTRAPTVEILFPLEGENVTGVAPLVSGTVYDDGDILLVQVRVDEGLWVTVNEHEGAFSATIGNASMSPGSHTISARALDPFSKAVAVVNVTVTSAASPGDSTTLSTGLPIVVMLLLGGALAGFAMLITMNATAGRKKILAAALVTAIVLAGGGLSHAWNSPGQGPGAPVQPAGNRTEGHPIAIPDFSCLSANGSVVSNDQLRGLPVVLRATELRRTEQEEFEWVDSQRAALPQDTVFVALVLRIDFNRSHIVELLSPFASPWIGCLDQYKSNEELRLFPGSMMIFDRSATSFWRSDDPMEIPWSEAISSL
jgi:hypothetical protein